MLIRHRRCIYKRLELIIKAAIITILVVATTILGFNVYSLREELLNAKEDAELSERRVEDLQRKLQRVNRLYADKERILGGIEEAVTELDRKIDLETLKKYVPKQKWIEIEPVIDRLKAFQQERRNEKGH